MKISNHNKFLITIGIFIIHLNTISMQTIPNASYAIYEGTSNDIVGGVPGDSKNVTFYTYNGDKIKTDLHNFEFNKVKDSLDKNAPKPQPIYYEIKYWPAISINMLWGLIKLKKGAPGDFIVFYDKNGNKIDSYRFDKNNNIISVYDASLGQFKQYKLENLNKVIDFPLDLSIVQERK